MIPVGEPLRHTPSRKAGWKIMAAPNEAQQAPMTVEGEGTFTHPEGTRVVLLKIVFPPDTPAWVEEKYAQAINELRENGVLVQFNKTP